jgi:hypothetical protein
MVQNMKHELLKASMEVQIGCRYEEIQEEVEEERNLV